MGCVIKKSTKAVQNFTQAVSNIIVDLAGIIVLHEVDALRTNTAMQICISQVEKMFKSKSAGELIEFLKGFYSQEVSTKRTPTSEINEKVEDIWHKFRTSSGKLKTKETMLELTTECENFLKNIKPTTTMKYTNLDLDLKVLKNIHPLKNEKNLKVSSARAKHIKKSSNIKKEKNDEENLSISQKKHHLVKNEAIYISESSSDESSKKKKKGKKPFVKKYSCPELSPDDDIEEDEVMEESDVASTSSEPQKKQNQEYRKDV
ncbi:uncharacterized protein LOC127291315 isoform X2 [Leptopilina boulardi]|uniref:uncharacterized protein LOC127291315 isoform X2 n=1 Tax=Leptopilina boulardi TaxID=63433 RepID=UPI0021F5AA9A|nr:uncharacterized protein LOC127291315 isoform X2 [Leptopilina boulardi]